MLIAGLLRGMSFAAARPGVPNDSSDAMRLLLAEPVPTENAIRRECLLNQRLVGAIQFQQASLEGRAVHAAFADRRTLEFLSSLVHRFPVILALLKAADGRPFGSRS